MSSSSHGDEARRALLADWIDRSLTNHPGDFLRRPLLETDDDWRIILAALCAEPVRAVEEMREQAARCASRWRDTDLDGHMAPADLSVAKATAAGIEAAIRALPIQPAAEGGADA